MPQDLSVIVQPLLKWYENNARKLPWRENTDPYRVWISEIMLQQTRVDTVIGYFNRFIAALPGVGALAHCPDDDLLKLWEGLGYYSRARNLKKAAQIIVQEHGGKLPESFEALRRLPGIGPYTAGAIASIAFEQNHAAVDGNVLRILSRILLDPADIAAPSVRRERTQMLEEIYPPAGQRGAFTQSLMELGATICLPNGMPLCQSCPVKDHCQAYENGEMLRYPIKTPKAAKQERDITILLIAHESRIALMRRNETGLLSGMWSFAHEEKALSENEVRARLKAHGIRAEKITPLPKKKHIFTHVIWQMHAYAVHAESGCDAFFWADAPALDACALPTAFAKFLPEALALMQER